MTSRLKDGAGAGGPRFVLHGIHGVYNYGCEAIVRGTVAILRTTWADCEILYQSRRPREDAASLAGCDLEVVDGRLRCGLSRRLVAGVLRRGHLPYVWVHRETMKWAKRADCLLSIGGDIFSLPPRAYRAHPVFRQVDFAEHVIASGTKFVLWGASVGPFEDWPAATEVFVRLLRGVALTTARESLTFDYLQDLGLGERVVGVADAAFLVPAVQRDEDFPFADSSRPTLAINLSPLSARRIAGTAGIEGVCSSQAVMIGRIAAALDLNILLVPHVICPWNPQDDDYSYLADIRTSLAESLGNGVALLRPDLGTMRTKGVLSRCDALIAARMHCGIAGVSAGVPTLFLSYSRKAPGMAEYVYGSQQWLLPVQEFTTESLVGSISALLGSRRELQQRLRAASRRFQRDAMRAGEALKEMLSSELASSEVALGGGEA